MSLRHATLLLVLIPVACGAPASPAATDAAVAPDDPIAARLASYTEVTLAPDLTGLSDAERQMLPLLIAAAQQIDPIYWEQAYGDPSELMAGLGDAERRFVIMNFGPWDRLDGNAPFLPGVGAKPAGANLYPHDVTRAELEAAAAPLRSLYTLVRRDDAGELVAVPYHEAFAEPLRVAADSLRQAAELAADPGLARYLTLRADALLTDDFQASDLAWMDMKDNTLEIVIGPIETYEDQLLGAKAAYEGLVLIKDRDWSVRLSRYAALLPSLQETLPVDAAYRAEEPGAEAELNAYDLVFVSGDGNAGSKSIAVNLPNDEQVQLQKGTRRLQIKNAMRAKFDAILGPIADELIAPEQREHVKFDAFFANTMFHEVAHGLGIKNTLNDRGTVRQALQEHASWVEEGKADILGLHMLTELHGRGELPDTVLMDNYVTFFASIFRSVRFGSTSAHGRANLVRFNYFRERGAFVFDTASATYAIDFEAMQETMRALAGDLLVLQGDGDRERAATMWSTLGVIDGGLQSALDRLSQRSIPVDIVYNQGIEVLDL